MNSPNRLELGGKPGTTSLSRWPIVAVCAVVAVLVAILIYSVQSYDPAKKSQEEAKKPEVQEEEKPVWLVEGSGLALDPKKERTSGVITPPAQEKPEPLVVVQREERADPALVQIRQSRTQATLAALSAPLVVKRNSSDKQEASSPDSAARIEPPSSPVPANSDYDPAADKDKEAFFERAQKDQWRLQERRTPGSPYELKTGAVIPGVMVTGINSDLPGNMIAQVTQNVFDSSTGRHLLIPQGTRLFGVYDSRVVYGQERVLIAWNRLIFPDGSSLTLGAMPGADMGGMAGFNDDVNNHYLRIFGSALLMSLVTGGMAYTMDSMNNNASRSQNGTSMQDEMTSALAQQLGQTTTTLLQKNLNIKPSLEIRPGYLFNIVVTKDIAFREPYSRWRR